MYIQKMMLDISSTLELKEINSRQRRRNAVIKPLWLVKYEQEKDKIKTKPDKNGKRGKARQCRRPIIVKKAEKRRKYKVKRPILAIPRSCIDSITPNEPVDSLSMGDEHLDTIPTTELEEFIKSCVENLVPNPSESEGENCCDVLACFTTFSNILFDAEYEFDSSDDQSLSDEDFPKEIFLNPLFEVEIISTKIDPHHFDVESDLIESMLNRDSSIISSSSKIDSLLDEFAGELNLLKSIPPGIDETDCYHENDIRLIERLLYDNSSSLPPEEFVSENSNADIESFSPSPILIGDSDSFMEEIDFSFNLDDPTPPGIEDDDDDSEGDNIFLERLVYDDPIPLPDTLNFSYDVQVFSSLLHLSGDFCNSSLLWE
uniref:Reverse transcriptase domain-containing protein n=1 Tax=Tanacetum cinerariifolium TaxID=118510 RepID=A0A699GNG6_TANCI|nr:hypothetical protein [Tanacetum cinerariifolium]